MFNVISKISYNKYFQKKKKRKMHSDKIGHFCCEITIMKITKLFISHTIIKHCILLQLPHVFEPNHFVSIFRFS